MAVTITSQTRSRTAVVAAHTYTLPVVRELPAQPVDTRDALTW